MDRYDSVSPTAIPTGSRVEKDSHVYRNGAVSVDRRGVGVSCLHSNTSSQHRGLGSGRISSKISSRETHSFVKVGSNLCNDTECGVLCRKYRTD